MAGGKLVYCNITKGTIGLTSGAGATTGAILGTLKLGDTLKLSLRLQKDMNGKVVDADQSVQSVKITLGKKDARPTGGYFRLKIGEEETPILSKNASSEEVEEGLNEINESKGVTAKWKVSYVQGSYIASIPQTAFPSMSSPIEVSENKLTPSSFVVIKAWNQDGIQYQSIRLTQAPCVTTNDFSLVVPKIPYFVRILGGQYPSELSMGVDEVQSLRIPGEFRGNFQVKRELAGSQPIGTTADVAVVKDALDTMSKSLGGTYAVVKSTTTGDAGFNITFGGKFSQSPQPLLTVNVIDAPNGDVTFSLPLNTTSLMEAIRAGGGTASLYLEGEASVTDNDAQGSTRTITLFSLPISVTEKLSEATIASLSNTNWAIPPEPSNYIPYSPTQVLFGSQHYETTFGGSPSKTYTITHNLNPPGNSTFYGIHATIRVNENGGRRLRDDEYTLTYTDNNTIEITTDGDWPANKLVVTISTAGPRSAFQQHQHGISEITGLDDRLQAITNQVDEIISVMPVINNVLTSTNSTEKFAITTPLNRTFFLLGATKYRDGKTIPPFAGLSGTTTTTATTTLGTTATATTGGDSEYFVSVDGDWRLSLLPRVPPLLLPAIHDTDVTNTTSVPTIKSAGGVYKNTSTSNMKVMGEIVAPNEYIAVANKSVYKVWKPYENKPSFYPTQYEKVLWQSVCTDSLLSVGRRLMVRFGVGAQSFSSNVACKFLLTIEHGPFLEEESNSYGPNLERLTYTKKVLEVPVIVSPQPQQNSFGTKISRILRADTSANPITYTEVINQDKFINGNWSGATTLNGSTIAPDTANFAIRAKVTQFDIENVDNASGYIQIALLGGLNDGNVAERLSYDSPSILVGTIMTGED